MKRYAQIIDEELGSVIVGNGTNYDYYKSIGMEEMDVEQAYDGRWYLSGMAPAEPEKTYIELRQAEYPAIADQLDMIYWDNVNGTTVWQDTIAEIKAKYPKDNE